MRGLIAGLAPVLALAALAGCMTEPEGAVTTPEAEAACLAGGGIVVQSSAGAAPVCEPGVGRPGFPCREATICDGLCVHEADGMGQCTDPATLSGCVETLDRFGRLVETCLD